MRPTQWVSFASGLLGVTLNTILLPIIIFKSSDRIGVYKYFLVFYTICAATFAFTQFCLLPTWYLPSDGFMFVSTVTLFPRWVQQIMVQTLCVAYTESTVAIFWSFQYRYFVIFSNDPWMLRKKYLPFCILSSVGLQIYLMHCCIAISPNKTLDDNFFESVKEVFDVNITYVGYIGGTIFQGEQLNSALVQALSSYIVFFAVYVVAISICCIRIGHKLKQMRNLSTASYRIQYRLYILLTLQTIFPLTCNALPAMIVFILPLLNVHVGSEILICGMVITFAQVADPLLAICLIADYKDAILGVFRTVVESSLSDNSVSTMQWTQVVALVSGFAALLMNMILLPFILFKSTARLGAYKYFLLAYVLCAATFAVCQVCILPTWYIPENGFLFLSTSPILPRKIQQIVLHVLCAVFLGICVIIMWCFLFRYLIILNPKPWLIRNPYLFICLFISFAVHAYYYFIDSHMEPTDELDNVFQEQMFNATGANFKDLAYIGGPLKTNGEYNEELALILVSYLVFDVIYFWSTSICWFLTGKKLRKMEQMAGSSRSHIKYQYRLYVLLTLQTLFPMIFNGLPAFAVFSCSLLEINLGDQILLCGMVITFAQVIDPLMTLFMISDYRNCLKRGFKRFTKYKVTPSNHVGSVTHPQHTGNS